MPSTRNRATKTHALAAMAGDVIERRTVATGQAVPSRITDNAPIEQARGF